MRLATDGGGTTRRGGEDGIADWCYERHVETRILEYGKRNKRDGDCELVREGKEKRKG